MKALEGGLRADLERLNGLFSQALDRYPPARLYVEVADVIDAVNDIRAVCRSRTRTTGSGKNRKTETRYYCSLVGKGTAIASMATWNRRMAAAFGVLPGYHELLEAIELAAWPR